MNKLVWVLALALAAFAGGATPALSAVNINTASKDELVALPGIGPAKAQAILDYRKANGPFKSVDDLKGVKGIGAKRLEKLRPEISVGPAPAKVATANAKGDAKSDAKAAGPSAKGEVRNSGDSRAGK